MNQRRRQSRRSGYAPSRTTQQPGGGAITAEDRPGAAATFSSGFNSFMATGSVALARRLGRQYGVEPAYRRRYLGALTANALFWPLRSWQSLAYGSAIRRTAVHPEPLFLLGFWRSGTTLLHNLLSVDPQWGYVSTYQAALPDLFLAGGAWLRRLLAKRLPETRGVDNIPVDFGMPQEEEIALMCSCGLSPYVALYFPRSGDQMLDYLFPEERLTEPARADWRREYRRLLQAATYNMDGRPLLLKSPSNTSRIDALLQLFPDARFVYIQRNPYETLRSYAHLLRLMNRWHALQWADFDELLGRQVQIYRRMAEVYLRQRALIPAGRLVEIKFEALEQDKSGTVRRIYDALGIAGYDAAAPALEAYVTSIAGFQKNPSHISAAIIQLVNEHVPFLVSEYGYQPMSP